MATQSVDLPGMSSNEIGTSRTPPLSSPTQLPYRLSQESPSPVRHHKATRTAPPTRTLTGEVEDEPALLPTLGNVTSRRVLVPKSRSQRESKPTFAIWISPSARRVEDVLGLEEIEQDKKKDRISKECIAFAEELASDTDLGQEMENSFTRFDYRQCINKGAQKKYEELIGMKRTHEDQEVLVGKKRRIARMNKMELEEKKCASQEAAAERIAAALEREETIRESKAAQQIMELGEERAHEKFTVWKD